MTTTAALPLAYPTLPAAIGIDVGVGRRVLVLLWAVRLHRVVMRAVQLLVALISRAGVVAEVVRRRIGRVAVVMADLQTRWLRSQERCRDEVVDPVALGLPARSSKTHLRIAAVAWGRLADVAALDSGHRRPRQTADPSLVANFVPAFPADYWTPLLIRAHVAIIPQYILDLLLVWVAAGEVIP